MTVTCLFEKKTELPLSLFRSRSLKHLTLVGFVDHLVASTWELPALTTLHLNYISLYLNSRISLFGYSLKFSTDSLPSLEEVDLCIRKPCKTETDSIVGLHQHSIESNILPGNRLQVDDRWR
ncbi:hypothetical protein Hanom_Chr07g00658811 [Helianthus anomalus]